MTDARLPVVQKIWNEIRKREKPLNTNPNYFQSSSRIAVVYQSFYSRATADRLYHDWMVEKIWTGTVNVNFVYVTLNL